jgi:hypothetical protein
MNTGLGKGRGKRESERRENEGMKKGPFKAIDHRKMSIFSPKEPGGSEY